MKDLGKAMILFFIAAGSWRLGYEAVTIGSLFFFLALWKLEENDKTNHQN